MGKSRLFDNIMQMIGCRNVVNGTTTVSTELDLELPRGYVAKIHKVRVAWNDIFNKAATGETANQKYALLLDPDDSSTVDVPNNTVEHDVILSGMFELDADATLGNLWDSHWHIYDFSHLEGLDILSARNLRFNIVSNSAQFDDSEVEVQIWYTLEKIKDTEIMELLDIL
jgi:hypothetical protein